MVFLVTFMAVMFASGFPPHPHISNGEFDLSSYSFKENGIVKLNGDWEFYPGVFLPAVVNLWKDAEKKRMLIKVPMPWNWVKSDGKRLPGMGYGTYHTRIYLPEGTTNWAFKFQTVSTAYTIFVNGKKLGHAGTPGNTRALSIPRYEPAVFDLQTQAKELDVVIHISNFHHRLGGIWDTVKFGPEPMIRKANENQLAMYWLIIGCLGIVSIYHLVLYTLRKKYISPLIFGAFSLVLAIRTMVTGEIAIIKIIPISWEILVKIEYLTFYMGIPLFTHLIYTLFQQEISRVWLKRLWVISLAFSLIVVLTPAGIFTYSVHFYQIIAIITSVYILLALVKAVKKKRPGAIVSLQAGFVMFVTMINDILFTAEIIDSVTMIPLGVIYLLLSQALIISRRFLKLLDTVEQQRIELEKSKADLEQRVLERTRELMDVNAKLKKLSRMDGLTGVANRRSFDEYLMNECRRMKRDKLPISLLLCDIDYFKKYNDTYGHQQGDECLKTVAETITNTLKRASDMVGRYGGEEFGVVLPNTPQEGAKSLAVRIKKALIDKKLMHISSPIADYVTISIGVATMTIDDNYQPGELIKQADIALYAAKFNGRNRVEIFESWMIKKRNILQLDT